NATDFNVMFIVFTSLQAFAGMWINAFIVCVLCIDWLKRKSCNSNEKILLFLGCSRFWHSCTICVFIVFLITYPWCFSVQPIPQLFAAIRSFFDTSNVWASACLSVFYCIKIANFRNTFFIYLKVKIDRIVPWLLLGSVLLSLIMCILAYSINSVAALKLLNTTTPESLLKLSVRMDEHLFPLLFLTGFMSATAFTAVVFSALFLLFSLWRHKRKMQTKAVKDLSTDAHIKAIKIILSFLFLYSINFTRFIMSLIYVTKKEKLATVIVLIFKYALPVFHSLILIFSNPKLEKTLLRTLCSWNILHCEKCKVC
ncbi:TA2R9 protein, partial [Bucco capensis]|nr:TA2R9 protein [Bucco capensis]